MSLTIAPVREALTRLGSFDSVIDARSESEYAIDRLPGAVNWPSLNDAERHLVGTEYVRVSAFLAKKHGAALVARNIAAHIERELLDKPRSWKPLVYCWRGGSRSAALATVLDQIGFQVTLIEGGYREYRRAVVADLDHAAGDIDFRVVGGPTGSGKSRLLRRLAAHGAQVLDLEALAEHRGSVLGLVPGALQPSQKQFDSRLWLALGRFDRSRPVFVESESKKIGDLRVGEPLIQRMRAAPCLRLQLSLDARVKLLLDDYDFFVTDTETFCGRLDALRALRGNEVIGHWQAEARAERTPEVVRALLVEHYDPIYAQSMDRNYVGMATPWNAETWDGTADSLDAVAKRTIGATR